MSVQDGRDVDGTIMEELGMYGDGTEDLTSKPDGMSYTDWRQLVRERDQRGKKPKKAKKKPEEYYKDMYPAELLSDSSWSRFKRKMGFGAGEAKACCCCLGSGSCVLLVLLGIFLFTVISWLLAHYYLFLV